MIRPSTYRFWIDAGEPKIAEVEKIDDCNNQPVRLQHQPRFDPAQEHNAATSFVRYCVVGYIATYLADMLFSRTLWIELWSHLRLSASFVDAKTSNGDPMQNVSRFLVVNRFQFRLQIGTIVILPDKMPLVSSQ